MVCGVCVCVCVGVCQQALYKSLKLRTGSILHNYIIIIILIPNHCQLRLRMWQKQQTYCSKYFPIMMVFATALNLSRGVRGDLGRGNTCS